MTRYGRPFRKPSRTRPWLRALFALLALAAPPAGRAGAADTQWWTSNSAPDYAHSEARGVVVDPDGVLHAGPRVRSFPTDSLTLAWCATQLSDGSIAVGGDRGRVLRWNERTGWKLWADLGTGQVLAIAADGNGAVAGTGPAGAIFRIGAGGDTTRLATTGERYVWGLTAGPGGTWYAATGTRGRLFQVQRGKATLRLDTEESNLVSLVSDGKGGVYAGGDSRGRIYHVRVDGSSRTLFDAAEDEIRALALGPDGMLWAAGLSASATTEDAVSDEGPQPAKSPLAGAHAVLYRVTPEGDGQPWWTAPQSLVLALAFANGALHTGTANRAGVYRIERANGATLELSPPQGQITAFVTGGGPAGGSGTLFAVASNPVAIWQIGPARAEDGELLSAVQDARRFARFGRLRAVAGGAHFSTRSGNSDSPDTTWSPWQEVGEGGVIASPPGRFLQWKVRTTSPEARVDEVTVSWRETNQPPRIDDLSVAPQGLAFREGEMSSRTESITQTLAGGQKVEYSATIGGARPLHEMPLWARGMRTLSWRGVDPNNDPLRYRVAVRAEPDGPWIEIAKDLDVSMLTWNTNTLADGRYRVKITASDAEGNAVGEALTAEAVSQPFTIDNTPPEVTALEARPGGAGVLISGAAEDRQGWLQRLDLSTDDGPWHSLAPDGGISDAPHLTFHATLGDLASGAHLVSVRAVDAAGNAATRATRVLVPPGRPASH